MHLSDIQMVRLSGIQTAFKYQTIWHLTSFWPFEYRPTLVFRSPLNFNRHPPLIFAKYFCRHLTKHHWEFVPVLHLSTSPPWFPSGCSPWAPSAATPTSWSRQSVTPQLAWSSLTCWRMPVCLMELLTSFTAPTTLSTLSVIIRLSGLFHLWVSCYTQIQWEFEYHNCLVFEWYGLIFWMTLLIKCSEF